MPLLQPEPYDLNYEDMLTDLHQTVPGMNWAERYVVSVDKVRADSECTKQHAHCPWCMRESSQFDGNALKMNKHPTSGNPIMGVCMGCSTRKQMYSFRCCYYTRPVLCCNCIMRVLTSQHHTNTMTRMHQLYHYPGCNHQLYLHLTLFTTPTNPNNQPQL
jgi:hypothetical protein